MSIWNFGIFFLDLNLIRVNCDGIKSLESWQRVKFEDKSIFNRVLVLHLGKLVDIYGRFDDLSTANVTAGAGRKRLRPLVSAFESGSAEVAVKTKLCV